jgi:hypothetical protein
VAGLVLEPLEVAGPLRWRLLLRTEEGEALASHQVALPAGDYEHRGFTDLYRFLRWQADPDRRVVSEAQLTAQVGDWIGRQALGEPVLAALLDEAPVTCRCRCRPSSPSCPTGPGRSPPGAGWSWAASRSGSCSTWPALAGHPAGRWRQTVGGQVLFVPFIFVMAGRWNPRRAREDTRKHDELVDRELAALAAQQT